MQEINYKSNINQIEMLEIKWKSNIYQIDMKYKSNRIEEINQKQHETQIEIKQK